MADNVTDAGTPGIEHASSAGSARRDQTGLDKLLLERECEDVVIRFTTHFDAQQYAEMEQYFAADGVWRRKDGDLVGIEGLRAGLQKRDRSVIVRHLLTNMRTTRISYQRAVVESYFVAYREVRKSDATGSLPLPSPVLIGRYADELSLVDGEWKISFRQAQVDFDASLTA